MRRVLIVDDEQPVRTMITRILNHKGYETKCEGNGWDGLQSAHTFMPDLIVCDIEMPYLDGHGMLEKLRSDSLTEAIPFIFLTGSDKREHVRKGMEEGADDYLTKPFSPEELCRTVETRLARQELWRKRLNEGIEAIRKGIAYSFPHDIRTPLTGIIGGASILSDESFDISIAEARSLSRLILLSGEQLNNLVRKYLRYIELTELMGNRESFIELRNRIIARQRKSAVNPRKSVEEWIFSNAACKGREKNLVVDLEDIPQELSIEEVKEIIFELLENAFIFSRAGTPVLLTGRSAGGRYTLSVLDRGRGIPPEKIGKLGVFVQADRHQHEQQGTGMGLAIVKKLMDLTGGELSIESRVNEFTRVTVSFPVPGAA